MLTEWQKQALLLPCVIPLDICLCHRPAASKHQVQTWALLYWEFHYAKRILETFFVHRYVLQFHANVVSPETPPISIVCTNILLEVQVQQRVHAHCKLVQKLQLLLGLCGFCQLFHQPPTLYTTACTAVCSGAHAGHDLPAVQLEVRDDTSASCTDCSALTFCARALCTCCIRMSVISLHCPTHFAEINGM